MTSNPTRMLMLILHVTGSDWDSSASHPCILAIFRQLHLAARKQGNISRRKKQAQELIFASRTSGPTHVRKPPLQTSIHD